jgi:hypothetical protein
VNGDGPSKTVLEPVWRCVPAFSEADFSETSRRLVRHKKIESFLFRSFCAPDKNWSRGAPDGQNLLCAQKPQSLILVV